MAKTALLSDSEYAGMLAMWKETLRDFPLHKLRKGLLHIRSLRATVDETWADPRRSIQRFDAEIAALEEEIARR